MSAKTSIAVTDLLFRPGAILAIIIVMIVGNLILGENWGVGKPPVALAGFPGMLIIRQSSGKVVGERRELRDIKPGEQVVAAVSGPAYAVPMYIFPDRRECQIGWKFPLNVTVKTNVDPRVGDMSRDPAIVDLRDRMLREPRFSQVLLQSDLPLALSPELMKWATSVSGYDADVICLLAMLRCVLWFVFCFLLVSLGVLIVLPEKVLDAIRPVGRKSRCAMCGFRLSNSAVECPACGEARLLPGGLPMYKLWRKRRTLTRHLVVARRLLRLSKTRARRDEYVVPTDEHSCPPMPVRGPGTSAG